MAHSMSEANILSFVGLELGDLLSKILNIKIVASNMEGVLERDRCLMARSGATSDFHCWMTSLWTKTWVTSLFSKLAVFALWKDDKRQGIAVTLQLSFPVDVPSPVPPRPSDAAGRLAALGTWMVAPPESLRGARCRGGDGGTAAVREGRCHSGGDSGEWDGIQCKVVVFFFQNFSLQILLFIGWYPNYKFYFSLHTCRLKADRSKTC